MKYKVHFSYITPEGELVNAGIYTPDQIDISIARSRSIITPVDATVSITTTNPLDETYITTVDGTGIKSKADVTEVVINPTKTLTKVTKVDINAISVEDLTKVKHIGKATAEKVIAARKVKPFESYQDLNNRVSLAKQKKWEDVAIIEFKFLPRVDNTAYKVDAL